MRNRRLDLQLEMGNTLDGLFLLSVWSFTICERLSEFFFNYIMIPKHKLLTNYITQTTHTNRFFKRPFECIDIQVWMRSTFCTYTHKNTIALQPGGDLTCIVFFFCFADIMASWSKSQYETPYAHAFTEMYITSRIRHHVIVLTEIYARRLLL